MTQTEIQGEPVRTGPRRGEPARTGRKRDHTRDGEILDATLDVLADVGYLGLTVDMVAARAHAGKATVYRRWASKDDLVLEAVRRMKQGQVDLDAMPDTGTLRGDMLALFAVGDVDEGERRLGILAGLAAMVQNNPEIAEAAAEAISGPWIAANRLLIDRAVHRGEFSTAAAADIAAQILPSMAGYRSIIRHQPLDQEFLLHIIDDVLLPMLHHTSARATAAD